MLKEVRRLNVSEEGQLRKIFGHGTEEETRGCRKWYNEVHTVYSSNLNVKKSRRMGWVVM
jgi:hypothetical protein